MPLLWLSLAFLGGIALADVLALTPSHWLAIAGLGVLLVWLSPRLNRRFPRFSQPSAWVERLAQSAAYPRWMPLAACLIALTLGGWRFQSEQQRVQQFSAKIARALGEAVVLQGIISGFPDERDTYTALVIELESLSIKKEPFANQAGQGWRTALGKVLVRASPFATWHYGDRVQVVGRLELPAESEGFSYRDYLARKDILAYMPRAEVSLLESNQGSVFYAAVYRLRQNGLVALSRIFPEPEASLLAGILLGIESGIPANVRQAFVDSGTMHIVAISGFNITLLAGLFMGVLGRLLGRWREVALSVVLISVYTILVGANASVVRAALMGVLTLFAAQIGRRQSGINSLVVVAALMAIFDPDILWDVSFQLSFAATLGLVLYASPLNEWAVRQFSRLTRPETAQRWGNLFGEWALFTLAAQVTTLPIILYHFQRLSIVALLVNPLILPVQPSVMVGGGIAMLLALIVPPLGQLFAYLVLPFVTYTIRMTEWAAALPYSSVRLSALPLVTVLLFYLAMFALTAFWHRLRRLEGLMRPSLLMGFLTISTVVVWQIALAAPDGRLHLWLLDVSRPSQSSEALLIQTPTGRSVLLNGGDSPSRLLDGLDRWLPITDRRLDWVVVGGARQAQIGAIADLIERQRVAKVWWAIPTGGTYATSAIRRAAKQQGVPIFDAEAGQSLDLGEGAQLRALAIGERGAVFVLEWRHFRALLPLGMDTEMRKSLLGSGELKPLSLWLLANSGSSWANPPQFLHRYQPQLVWLSVAKGDWYGLPHQEILQALEGYSLLRTDLHGWIHLQTDGEQMWVEVEKNATLP